MSFGSQLVDNLRHYKKPLTITLDNGALIAASFDFGNSYAFSVIFRHPEGDVEIGANLPTRAERIGIPAEDLPTASYTDLQTVVSDHLGQSCTLLDECPWVVGAGSDVISCFDASGEQVQESAALREALIEWLRREDEDALEDEHLYPELSEGLVGYAILEALPPAEVEY